MVIKKMLEVLFIENVTVVNPDSIKKNCDIVCKNGKIVDILPHKTYHKKNLKKYYKCEVINGNNKYALPGMINIHTHGVDMFNTMDMKVDSIINMAKSCIKYGVCSFLPTIMTSSIQHMCDVADIICSAMNKNNLSNDIIAEILGANFEGPFISPARSGAQDKKNIVTPDEKNIKFLWSRNKDVMKIITVAPEVQNGIKTIKFFSSKNIVVSCGHTDATYEQMKEAHNNGAKLVTHMFNAMRGLHHREPGVVGFVLTHKIFTEIIPDGLHVHKDLVIFLLLNKPDDIIVVTDTMIGPKIDTLKYLLDNREIYYKDGKLVLKDGTLAGSSLGFNTGIKNIFKWGKDLLPLTTIAKVSSYNAAKLLNIDDRKGSIKKGKDADIVIFDKEFNLVKTICKSFFVSRN